MEALQFFCTTFGCDINLADNSGITPLYMAAQDGKDACVQMLIDYNADIHKARKNGMMPIHAAASCGRVLSV